VLNFETNRAAAILGEQDDGIASTMKVALNIFLTCIIRTKVVRRGCPRMDSASEQCLRPLISQDLAAPMLTWKFDKTRSVAALKPHLTARC